MFFRLLLGTVAMLAFGYSGENGSLNAWLAFALGMAGWAFILQEIFIGEAAKEAGNLAGHVKSSYDIMKFIVSVGWSIYPLGYFFGFLMFQHHDDAALNLIYNLADFVNKIAFCLAIWCQARHRRRQARCLACLRQARHATYLPADSISAEPIFWYTLCTSSICAESAQCLRFQFQVFLGALVSSFSNFKLSARACGSCLHAFERSQARPEF